MTVRTNTTKLFVEYLTELVANLDASDVVGVDIKPGQIILTIDTERH